MITLNGHAITPTIFPDKTSQVWKLLGGTIWEDSTIVWNFEDEGEIMHLAQLVSLVNTTWRYAKTHLHFPYMPYARQDKQDKPLNNVAFALTPFSYLINSLHFYKVTAFDVHNPVFTRLMFTGFENILPEKEIAFAIEATQPDLICYPDEGASKRYPFIKHPSICATKVRNKLTGEITGTQVNGDYTGKSILIVDDICDGGMTFIKLAEALKGAKEINLYISHGLFTKGIAVLYNSGINRIFTKDGEIKR